MQVDSRKDESPLVVCEYPPPNRHSDVLLPRVYEALVAFSVAFVPIGFVVAVFHSPTTVTPLLVGLPLGMISSAMGYWERRRRHIFELRKRSINIYPGRLDVIFDGQVAQTMTHASEIYVSKETQKLSWLGKTEIEAYEAENDDAIVDFDSSISNLDQLLQFLNQEVINDPLVS